MPTTVKPVIKTTWEIGTPWEGINRCDIRPSKFSDYGYRYRFKDRYFSP